MKYFRVLFYLAFGGLAYYIYTTDIYQSDNLKYVMTAFLVLGCIGFGMILIVGIKGNLQLPWAKEKAKKK